MVEGNKFLFPKAKRSTWTESIVSNSKRTYHKSIKQPKVQSSGLNTVMLSVLAGIIWRCCQCLDLIRDGPRPGQIESAHHCSPSAECGFWQTCMRRWFQFALIRRFPPNAANVGGRCHHHDGYDTPTKFCFQTWQVLICLCLVENKQRTLNMLTLNQIETKAGLKDKG